MYSTCDCVTCTCMYMSHRCSLTVAPMLVEDGSTFVDKIRSDINPSPPIVDDEFCVYTLSVYLLLVCRVVGSFSFGAKLSSLLAITKLSTVYMCMYISCIHGAMCQAPPILIIHNGLVNKPQYSFTFIPFQILLTSYQEGHLAGSPLSSLDTEQN